MAYAHLSKLSSTQLARHIRTLAKTTANVVLTIHAKERMVERLVSNEEVLECLRKGGIRRPPEPNSKTGSLECRMECKVLKRDLACIAALSDENPNLIVVTIFEKI